MLSLSGTAAAQTIAEYALQVVVDSAFLRAAPAEDAPAVSSVFENDSLVAVGRSVDGQWLQVKRPGARAAAGWIAGDLVLFTFEVGKLPITDLTTGVTGPTPVVDTGTAVLTAGEVVQHSAPARSAPQVGIIPMLRTVPVLERTPNNQWLKVNYRGTVGWVAVFLVVTSADLNAVPVSPEYAGDPQYAAYEIIPPEVQLAQADRLLAYIQSVGETAAGVADYWRMLSRGETMACNPPGDAVYFVTTARDLVELPELRRQEQDLQQAVDDLNAAIDAMRRCGVYRQFEIREAYSKALNAQVLLRVVAQRMENVRKQIGG
ncbi:MAG: SH3 domain-containing protein [Chloroflexi bacterium]|nr:SH3 domain-containing protein [Chloroflexota bacterium]